MLLMLMFRWPLGAWKVKRQGSDAADAPVWRASGAWNMKRQGSDAADAPVCRASRCLEGDAADAPVCRASRCLEGETTGSDGGPL